jgi:hypothetical protein
MQVLLSEETWYPTEQAVQFVASTQFKQFSEQAEQVLEVLSR